MAKTLGNNIGLVLNQFQNQLKYQHEGLKTIHHDSQDFNSIMTSLRTKKLITDDTDRLTECFAYYRTSPLVPPLDGMYRRASKAEANQTDRGALLGYKCVRADMRLNFMYITSSIVKSDYFEIAYACEDGIASVKKFQLNLSQHQLGIFDYTCHWEPLETREYAFEDTMFKAIGGTCMLQGEFFILNGELGGKIEEINYKTYQENDAEDTVTLIEDVVID